MRNHGRRSSIVAAVILTVAGVATGCGGEQLAEQLGEQAIDGQVDIEDDSVSITDQEGNEFAVGEGTEIPPTWPTEVPLYSGGTLVLVTSQSDGTATALWEAPETVDQAVAAYDDALTSSNFRLDQDASIAGSIVRTYLSESHTVNVTAVEVDSATNLSIAVIPN